MEQNRRKHIYLLLTAMAISAFIIITAAARGIARERFRATQRDASRAAQQHLDFILKEYNGHLALFREHSEKPYRILELEVYLLSEEEQAAIAEGITAKSEEELEALLEDWDS